MPKYVPDWAVRETAEGLRESLRRAIQSHVYGQMKFENSLEKARALRELNEALKDLEEEVLEIIKTRLFQYVNVL